MLALFFIYLGIYLFCITNKKRQRIIVIPVAFCWMSKYKSNAPLVEFMTCKGTSKLNKERNKIFANIILNVEVYL